jgi:hypothetical protein
MSECWGTRDEIEVLEPDAILEPEPEPVHVTALTRPFNFDRTQIDITGRHTIAELLVRAGIPSHVDTRVYINGHLIKPEHYGLVRPKPGTDVLVRVVPRGFGGGNQSKLMSIIQIVVGVLMIIVGIVALIGGGVGAALIVPGVMLVLSGVLNLLLPPPTPPKLRALSGLSTQNALSPALSIGGGRNALRAYAPVPRLLGRFLMFPPYGALPFTEEVGNDQYVRMLFVCSLGPCDVEALRIGETALSNFDGVEVEVRTGAAGEPPMTLYTTRTFEDPMNVALTAASGTHIRTSQTGAVELAIAIGFGTGLVGFDKNGSAYAIGVDFAIQYRRVGGTRLFDAPMSPFRIADVREGLARGGLRWKPCNVGTLWPASAWAHVGLGSFDGTKVSNGVLSDVAFNVNASPINSWIRLTLDQPREFGRVQVTTDGSVPNGLWNVYTSDDLVTWNIVYAGFVTGVGVSTATWIGNAGPHLHWLLLKTNGPVAGGNYLEVEWCEVAAGVVADQFDVFVTRLTPDATDPFIRDLSTWTALRTYGVDPAILLPGLAAVALRIKATDQLSGLIDTFNCIVTSRVLDFQDYPSGVLTDRPIGYWRLGEILGAPTAFDATGNARAGTYLGAPTLGAAGLLTDDTSTAMSCDGGNDEVVVPAMAYVDMGGLSFTIEAVILPATIANEIRGIVHKGDGLEFAAPGHFGWSLVRSAGDLRFIRNSGGASPTMIVGSGVLQANVTKHVIVTYDFATGIATMWVNGAIVVTAAVGNATYFDAYQLGIAHASNLRWEGRLQEISVRAGVLSNARVAARYAAFQGTRSWNVAPTSNPASLYRTVLQDRGNAKAVADARLDVPTLEAWHGECVAGGRSCNIVADYSTTVGALLHDIAAAGRATPTMNGTKFSVVRDIPQTVPVQHITPRNSRNFKGTRIMKDAVHALKVRFIDPEAGWQQSERIVYDDGFDETNATNFDVFEPIGVTDADWAWRLARYHLAATRGRPEVYEVEMDIGALACRRGDLVRCAYDVIEWGISQGRIKAVAMSGSNATGVTLDEVMPMEGGREYAARIALSDGTSRLADLVNSPGNQTTIVFTAPMVPPVPAVGDQVMFGLKGLETVPAIVASIRRGPDLSAILTLVDQAPLVMNADQGTVPPWDPQMTVGAGLIATEPPTPIIETVVSDESVLIRNLDGSLQSRILLYLRYQSTSNLTADWVEVRFRRSDSTSPFDTLGRLAVTTTRVSIVPVEDGVAYDIRVRTVSDAGQTSRWVEVLNYVVVGKTSLPVPPQGLRLENDRLAWDYPDAALDFLGFELRRSAGPVGNWDTAFEMHAGFLSDSSYILPSTIFGLWTFLVSAVDTSGNASAPVMLTIDFGSAALHNLVESYDFRAHGWPGSISQGTVIPSSGNLWADGVPTGFWTNGLNRFWSPSGTTLFWAGTYKQMTYIFNFFPAPGSAGARIVFDLTVLGGSWNLEWKKGALDYAPFPGSLEAITEEQYTFRLTTQADVIQGQINALTLYVDADNLSEDIANFPVSG